MIAEALNLARDRLSRIPPPPGGPPVLRLCRAEACQSLGADKLAAHGRERLGVDWHDTTSSGAVTLEPVFCLGLCAIAPTAMLDGAPPVRERCGGEAFADGAAFVAKHATAPEWWRRPAGYRRRRYARQHASTRVRAKRAIYYGLGVTEHSRASTAVMALANLAMTTGNIRRPGVGVNPLRGQNNPQGSCDMGFFPHELPGCRYRHISNPAVRAIHEGEWGVTLDPEPDLRIPNRIDAALDGSFRGIYIQSEDIVQSDPDSKHITAGLAAMECVVVHDLFINETANYAHVFLPGSTFLEKDGTFINAERRINLVRKVMALRVMAQRTGMTDWEGRQQIARAMGCDWNYTHPSEIVDEIARTTPTFAGVSFAKLEQGSLQCPVNDKAPQGTPTTHVDGFVRGKGYFVVTECVPTDEKVGPRFALLLTTGTWSGTTRICWKSIRRTPRIAACAMVIWSDWRLVRAIPRNARASPIGWRRASYRRRSIIQPRRRT